MRNPIAVPVDRTPGHLYGEILMAMTSNDPERVKGLCKKLKPALRRSIRQATRLLDSLSGAEDRTSREQTQMLLEGYQNLLHTLPEYTKQMLDAAQPASNNLGRYVPLI